jgi:hypothetical protein
MAFLMLYRQLEMRVWDATEAYIVDNFEQLRFFWADRISEFARLSLFSRRQLLPQSNPSDHAKKKVKATPLNIGGSTLQQ